MNSERKILESEINRSVNNLSNKDHDGDDELKIQQDQKEIREKKKNFEKKKKSNFLNKNKNLKSERAKRSLRDLFSQFERIKTEGDRLYTERNIVDGGNLGRKDKKLNQSVKSM